MVAGEASGDLLAGLLLGGLNERWPQLETFGIGGPNMTAQGFTAWWPHDKLAVRGYVEVLGHLREILAIRRRLAERLIAEPPDVFVGVDAPDFNLGVETRLRANGITSVHFVSPSIWAWRGKRIEKIRRAADLVLCLFPFEPAIYERAGIAARYVGHPLADRIPLTPPRRESRAAIGFSDDDTVVALLPGSRRAEIRYIAPRLLAAARVMAQRRPGLRFVLPLVPGLEALFESVRAEATSDLDLTVLPGRSHDALAACDVTLVASGTATLEAALHKRPMVITYVMPRLSWLIMKGMNYQPWVGLPNILSNRFVVPEVFQDDATPERLADLTLAWLDDPQGVAAVVERFEEIHRELRCDTAARATEAIATLLEN